MLRRGDTTTAVTKWSKTSSLRKWFVDERKGRTMPLGLLASIMVSDHTGFESLCRRFFNRFSWDRCEQPVCYPPGKDNAFPFKVWHCVIQRAKRLKINVQLKKQHECRKDRKVHQLVRRYEEFMTCCLAVCNRVAEPSRVFQLELVPLFNRLLMNL